MSQDLFGQHQDPPYPPAPGSDQPPVPLHAQPLAERMRPHRFEQWVGQHEAAGPESPLRRMLRQGSPPSLIFWGPPGSGKTTLAHLIATETGLRFQPLSAVTSGIKDVKRIIEAARNRLVAGEVKVLLFIDEIHRFNKAQQDAFLPHVENGTIVLVGATTQNPSFSVIAPLLSRCRVIALDRLRDEDLVQILQRTLTDRERGLGAEGWQADQELMTRLAQLADGDARQALNLLEQCVAVARDTPRDEANAQRLRLDDLGRVLKRQHLMYDRAGEEHFNLLSAFHKSMRASDPNATIYWMARMIEAGEEPTVISRRILACASEDVGLADPQAMVQAVAAHHALESLGLPEGRLPITQAALYVALAPKSNSVLKAIDGARRAVGEFGALPVPLHLRNAPTGLMKQLGYGHAYQYDHENPEHFSGQPCLPDDLAQAEFYHPGAFGFERDLRKRIAWWNKKREERRREAKHLK